MRGKADETEHLPFELGLAPPSQLISLNGKPKISCHSLPAARNMVGGFASQTLIQGKV
jgi:hypothetical protein